MVEWMAEWKAASLVRQKAVMMAGKTVGRLVVCSADEMANTRAG